MRVTQDDIDAAADFLESWEPGPEMTIVKLANAFSAHRELAHQQAVEQIVAWLRNQSNQMLTSQWHSAMIFSARAIEAGEPFKEAP